MEGFFSKNDRNLWLEAIDLLSSVNELVREDIRDSFIFPKEEGAGQENESLNSSQNSIDLNASQISNKGLKKKNTSRKSSSTKLALVRKNSKKKDTKSRSKNKKLSRTKTITSSDGKKIPENINVFRPPNIWNYPYHSLFKLKHANEENVIYDIRKVDPSVNYKDGRIQKFMGLFIQIIENMRNYWKTEKPNAWDYFFVKILKALGITYVSYKMLKEEEEEQKRLEEENERKRQEEIENEAKQKEMMAFLEKQTGETMEKKIEGNKKATRDIRDLFDGEKIFETAKPIGLMEKIISIGSNPEDIILDFFSGSSTTAHAIMKLNSVDSTSNRRFILIQISDKVKEKSDAAKAGYETIDQIGIERIIRAAKKIREEHPDTKADLGFRHFTLKEPSLETLNKLETFEPESGLMIQNTVLDDFGGASAARWLRFAAVRRGDLKTLEKLAVSDPDFDIRKAAYESMADPSPMVTAMYIAQIRLEDSPGDLSRPLNAVRKLSDREALGFLAEHGRLERIVDEARARLTALDAE